jgi:muconolactone delta-isomerase
MKYDECKCGIKRMDCDYHRDSLEGSALSALQRQDELAEIWRVLVEYKKAELQRAIDAANLCKISAESDWHWAPPLTIKS